MAVDHDGRQRGSVTSKKAPQTEPVEALSGSDLVRFGIAVERPLLEAFDEHLARRNYVNRSEALRDLIRAELARDAWDRGDDTVATISLIYDHHVRELTERLVEVQHEFGTRVISATHVHLDHDHCLEVVLAKGPANVLKRLADRLIGAKGVISGDVSGMSIVGRPAAPPGKKKGQAHRHGHEH
jgi:CopG family nickel-responsive transcriptional regulator